jgi:hypothetical protein
MEPTLLWQIFQSRSSHLHKVISSMRKINHNIVLQGVRGATKWFWNVCARQLRGVHDGNNSKYLA